jgi:hypothetical protein
MMFSQFFIWWYGRGWRELIQSFPKRLQTTADNFSVNTLLRTIFAPWRRVVSYPGRSLSDHFHAWLDNLVSRVIGFIVRFIVLVAAAFAMAAVGVVTLIEIITWPCIPFAVIGCIILGIIG